MIRRQRKTVFVRAITRLEPNVEVSDHREQLVLVALQKGNEIVQVPLEVFAAEVGGHQQPVSRPHRDDTVLVVPRQVKDVAAVERTALADQQPTAAGGKKRGAPVKRGGAALLNAFPATKKARAGA